MIIEKITPETKIYCIIAAISKNINEIPDEEIKALNDRYSDIFKVTTKKDGTKMLEVTVLSRHKADEARADFYELIEMNNEIRSLRGEPLIEYDDSKISFSRFIFF